MSGPIFNREAFVVGLALTTTLGACTGSSDATSAGDGGKTISEQPPDDGPSDAGKQVEPDEIPPAATDAGVSGTDSGASVADASIEALDANETGTEDAGWPPTADVDAPEYRCSVEGCCFAPRGLARIVRLLLDIQPHEQFSNTDLGNVAELDVGLAFKHRPIVEGEVKSLDGIECLSALEKLTLHGRVVVTIDLSPVSKLLGLKSFASYGVSMDNLNVLAPLTHLEEILVQFDHDGLPAGVLNDISGVIDHDNLRMIDIQGQLIRDISALSNKARLEVAYLSGNPINNIGVFRDATSLRDLSLQRSCVSDISALVDNPSFGEGDRVDLRFWGHWDDFDYPDCRGDGVGEFCNTQRQNIEALRARGVSVETDCVFE